MPKDAIACYHLDLPVGHPTEPYGLQLKSHDVTVIPVIAYSISFGMPLTNVFKKDFHAPLISRQLSVFGSLFYLFRS